MKHISKFLIIFILILLQSCVSYKYSYEEDNSPVFKGDFTNDLANFKQSSNPSIKVVSFNIKFAQNIDEAINLLNKEPLNTADVILLQEMDEKGTEQLAKSLNMSYVYYPATLHPKNMQNFGNAILSKWEIKDSKKIKLPYPGAYLSPLKGKKIYTQKDCNCC